MLSETSKSKDILAPYCEGIGMDVGFGGDKIVPTAWAFDMPQPYTAVGSNPQQLRGDCRQFPFLCDNALDYIYSSHVLEDFTYGDLILILFEWRRVLKPGGVIVTNCPDQRRFLAHCAATGQSVNDNHKEPDFSLNSFSTRVLTQTGTWDKIFEIDPFQEYSWLQVIKKVS